MCVSVVVSPGVGGRGELSLAEVQCHLDKEGASDLVIDLIMNATSDRIFQESILLAIALLEGGNTVIQVSRVDWVRKFLLFKSMIDIFFVVVGVPPPPNSLIDPKYPHPIKSIQIVVCQEHHQVRTSCVAFTL